MSTRSEIRERWRRILRDQPSSGLTVAAFCRRAGVPYSGFYKWRDKLGRQAVFSEVKLAAAGSERQVVHVGDLELQVSWHAKGLQGAMLACGCLAECWASLTAAISPCSRLPPQERSGLHPTSAASRNTQSTRLFRGTPQAPLPFTPKAYVDKRGTKTIVLALGPLTNLAAALKDDAVRNGVAKILVQGPPDAAKNWNLGYDPEAFATVRGSGVRLQFVESGPAAVKTETWRNGNGPTGHRTSIGEGLLARLLGDSAFRQHYTQGVFAQFTDELLLIACVDDDLFETVATASGDGTLLRPKDRDGIAAILTRLLSEGRQAKSRVVFAPGSLPDNILRADVRKRKAGILAKNGESEWFAQLLMNELHEHLGSYSIIGVKMGLRAAELLNAP